MGTRNETYVCVPCRRTAKSRVRPTCPTCQKDMVCAGARWRPPPRADDRAWDRVDAGDWFTESPRPDSPAQRAFAARPRHISPARPYARAHQILTSLGQVDGGATWAELGSDAEVRAQVARGTDSAALLDVLAHDKDPAVRAAALGNEALVLSEPVAGRVARNKHATVRIALAGRADATARQLRRLAKDSNRSVRQAVAANPNTPVDALRWAPLGAVPTHRLDEVVLAFLPNLSGSAPAMAVLRTLDADLELSQALRVVNGAFASTV